MPARTETILVDKMLTDSREQRPLLFPDTLGLWKVRGAGRVTAVPIRIEQKVERLHAGDYCLASAPRLAGVERKLGIAEVIQNNLTTDRPRFLRALHRFADWYQYPYLFIEQFPPNWWGAHADLEIVQGVDSLMHEVAKLGIRLLWNNRAIGEPTARRRAGELILRILLAHKENENV